MTEEPQRKHISVKGLHETETHRHTLTGNKVETRHIMTILSMKMLEKLFLKVLSVFFFPLLSLSLCYVPRGEYHVIAVNGTQKEHL